MSMIEHNECLQNNGDREVTVERLLTGFLFDLVFGIDIFFLLPSLVLETLTYTRICSNIFLFFRFALLFIDCFTFHLQ